MAGIFLHGLGQTAESWDQVLSLLNRTDILCPDLFGLAEGKPITYGTLYRSFSGYCDALDGCVDLCGLSLGGVLALNYTAENPEKVHSLVLAAAQYRMPKTILRLQNTLFRLMPGFLLDHAGLSKKEMISLCGSMIELDFSQVLPEMHCPTLVLCGEKDTANRKASAELAQRIPGAQLRTIPEAGHEINLDAPEELARLLRTFYEEIPGFH